MAKKKPKLIDRGRRRDLLNLLDGAMSRELIYVDVLLQSAYAAALQVMDKRIEFLETKKPKEEEEAFIGEFFLDVLIDLLVGGIGGQLLRSGMESILRPVVRSRQTLIVAPAQVFKIRPYVDLDRRKLQAGRIAARKRLQANFTRIANGEDYSAYRIVPDLILSSVITVGRATARARVNLPRPSPPRPSTGRRPNTASVEFVVSTQKFYSDQRSAIETTYNTAMRQVEYEDIDVNKADDLEAFLLENVGEAMTEPEQRDEYRDRFLLFYEACMWAHVLHVQSRISDDRGPAIGYTPRGAQAHLNSPDNYGLVKEGGDGVVYDLPLPGSEALTVQDARRTVAISQDCLEYLIERLPRSFDSPDLKTFHESAWNAYGGGRSKRHENAAKIHAYEGVLDLLRLLEESVDTSFAALARSGALPGLPSPRRLALPR